MRSDDADLDSALRGVRLAAFDVDGVLTDGRFGLTSSGGEGGEVVFFHTRDGLGIRLLITSGIPVAFVTGRVSEPVRRRAEALGVPHIVRGSGDKAEDLRKIAAAAGVSLAEVLFVGDDLPDLPAFKVAGVAVAVADAAEEVRARADLVTVQSGGRGAVREVADMILRSQGLLDLAVSRFAGETG